MTTLESQAMAIHVISRGHVSVAEARAYILAERRRQAIRRAAVCVALAAAAVAVAVLA